jgi:hypothetical protein
MRSEFAKHGIFIVGKKRENLIADRMVVETQTINGREVQDE